MDGEGQAGGDGHGEKQGNCQGIAAGQFEHHDGGGDRCAENGGGHRAHSQYGIEALAGGHFGKDACRHQAIGTAGHGPQIERRRDNATSETRGEGDRRGRRLGDDQQQYHAERQRRLQRLVGGLVTDTEHVGHKNGNGADGQPADHRPCPQRHGDIAGDIVGAGQRELEDDGDGGAGHPEKRKGGDLPVGGNGIIGDDEGGDLAEPQPRDDAADNGGHDDGHEGAHGVVAENNLVGEQHAGDRRVEGRGNRAGHTTGDQRALRRAGELQALAELLRQRRAEMHDRTLAAGAGAAAQRDDGDEGARQPVAQAKTATAEGARLNDVGHAERPAAGHEAGQQQADNEAADGRRQQHYRPGRRGGGAGDVFRLRRQPG